MSIRYINYILLKEPQLLVAPKSRLIPIGTDALFTCKFRNVHVTLPYWKVNEIETNIHRNREFLRTRGFLIEENESITDADGIQVITLTLRVDGSYAGVNNTVISCKITSSIESVRATILTIAGIMN